MENNKVSMQRRAKMVLFEFSPEDRERILHAIEAIAETDADKWPKGKVYKVDTSPGAVATRGDVYVLRVDPQIRVIFQLTEEKTILILDIVLRDTLLMFAPKVG
jgi:hypothetical protein